MPHSGKLARLAQSVASLLQALSTWGDLPRGGAQDPDRAAIRDNACHGP